MCLALNPLNQTHILQVFNEDTSHKFMRYLLLEVDDTFGEHGHQKRLRVLQEKTGRECVVFLRGVWLNSPVSIGK